MFGNGAVKLSVIVPVFNEVHRVVNAIQQLLEAPLELTKELLIVDDCSTDGTRDSLDSPFQQVTTARFFI